MCTASTKTITIIPIYRKVLKNANLATSVKYILFMACNIQNLGKKLPVQLSYYVKFSFNATYISEYAVEQN